MKKWELRITHDYRTTAFRFKKITEAEAFLDAFVGAKQPEEDRHGRETEWEYSIHPVMDEEPKEVSDDNNDE